MTHDNKKPFKCETCDDSCAQSATLKRHNESVHEKKKLFKCEICDYNCKQIKNFKRCFEQVRR